MNAILALGVLAGGIILYQLLIRIIISKRLMTVVGILFATAGTGLIFGLITFLLLLLDPKSYTWTLSERLVFLGKVILLTSLGYFALACLWNFTTQFLVKRRKKL
jgi:hypothetical protein